MEAVNGCRFVAVHGVVRSGVGRGVIYSFAVKPMPRVFACCGNGLTESGRRSGGERFARTTAQGCAGWTAAEQDAKRRGAPLGRRARKLRI